MVVTVGLGGLLVFYVCGLFWVCGVKLGCYVNSVVYVTLGYSCYVCDALVRSGLVDSGCLVWVLLFCCCFGFACCMIGNCVVFGLLWVLAVNLHIYVVC